MPCDGIPGRRRERCVARGDDWRGALRRPGVAVAFLESMHAAAMQVTGLRARRTAAQRPEAAE